jgi:ferrochelatase
VSLAYDAVLLLAFGGPNSAQEIRPFLSRVLQGIPVPPSRIEEVAHHYEKVGGRSPLTEITFKQAWALENALRNRGLALPVYVGLRHSTPFVRETLERMAADGIQRAVGFILSAHRTEASWERYQKTVAAAKAELGDRCPRIDYCPVWHVQPLLIEAWSELVRFQLEQVESERRGSATLVFTAHSVPVAMAACSPYVEQIHETARRVAARVGHDRWMVAYQSRSGTPSDPWLEPDVLTVIRDLQGQGVTGVVVAPIGFICDHVEVLYDLDIEARKLAGDLGIQFYRARCVNDHPLFIRMMADVIEAVTARARDAE